MVSLIVGGFAYLLLLCLEAYTELKVWACSSTAVTTALSREAHWCVNQKVREAECGDPIKWGNVCVVAWSEI